MNTQKFISIIIPVYNEQENITHVYTQVSAIMQSLQSKYTYEFIFINDGSADASWPLLVKLAHSDPQVTALNLSRNFGHQAALTAGYAHAQGDAVITMDADLQDPPSLLLNMIHQWEQGAQIVYARRINRKDAFLKRITAYCYYLLLDAVAQVSMPRNVGDFRLIDRTVVQLLNEMPERARSLRGMVAWLGFSQAFVDFNRPERLHGVSGYTWKKMFKLGFDGLTSFSMMPLRIALYMSLFLMTLAIGALCYAIGAQLFFEASFSFVQWFAIGITLCVGILFGCIWMLGEYVGRIYDQQKERPLFIVAQKVGFAQGQKMANVAKHTQRELQ
jgi:dolichol-phosphate mannosyltransferase